MSVTEALAIDVLNRRVTLPEAVAEIEAATVKAALRKTGFNVTEAAQLLGVHRNTLSSKRKRTA
jgi:DNA-binding NtrC family response regulator